MYFKRFGKKIMISNEVILIYVIKADHSLCSHREGNQQTTGCDW